MTARILARDTDGLTWWGKGVERSSLGRQRHCYRVKRPAVVDQVDRLPGYACAVKDVIDDVVGAPIVVGLLRGLRLEMLLHRLQ